MESSYQAMRWRTLLIVTFLSGCRPSYEGTELSVASAGPPAARRVLPLVLERPVECDFGDLPADSVVRRDIALQNKSQRPVRIEKVTKSCGCTAVSCCPLALDPGQSAVCSVALDTHGRSGAVGATIMLVAAEPAEAVVGSFSVQGWVGRSVALVIDPEIIDVASRLSSAAVVVEARMYVQGDKAPTAPSFDGERLPCGVSVLSAGPARECQAPFGMRCATTCITLVVSAEAELSSGPIRGFLRGTSGALTAEAPILFRRNMEERRFGLPGSVFLDNIHLGTVAERLIDCTSSTEGGDLDMRMTPMAEWIQASLVNRGAAGVRATQLRIRVKPSDRGLYSTRLTISDGSESTDLSVVMFAR